MRIGWAVAIKSSHEPAVKIHLCLSFMVIIMKRKCLTKAVADFALSLLMTDTGKSVSLASKALDCDPRLPHA